MVSRVVRWAGPSVSAAMGFLLGMVVSAEAADFNYSAYRPTSLAAAIAEHERADGADYVIEAGAFKYRVTATYTGRHRETNTKVRELIRHWVKALRHPEKFETFFDHEVEVESGGQTYWLPIQNPLVPSFATEVKDGTAAQLYIMLIGAVGDHWVFIINEFEAL